MSLEYLLEDINTNDDIAQTATSLEYFLEDIGLPVVSSFGLLGNILSIIVLVNGKESLNIGSSFINLLIFLGLSDTLLLILMNCIYMGSYQRALQTLAIPYLIPLLNMAMTCSVYTVVAITVERYAAIRQSSSRLFNARYLILFIIVFAVCLNLIRFFELTTGTERIEWMDPYVNTTTTYEEEEAFYYVIKPTWLKTNPVYSFVNIIFLNLVLMSLIPFVVLTVLNILIFKSMRGIIQSTQQSDTTMAAILFSIVIILLCCYSIKFGINMYEGFLMLCFGETMKSWNLLCVILSKCSNLLKALNSSVKIFIYTAIDIKFRQSLFLLLKCRRGAAAATTKPMDMENMTVVTEENML